MRLRTEVVKKEQSKGVVGASEGGNGTQENVRKRGDADRENKRRQK